MATRNEDEDALKYLRCFKATDQNIALKNSQNYWLRGEKQRERSWHCVKLWAEGLRNFGSIIGGMGVTFIVYPSVKTTRPPGDHSSGANWPRREAALFHKLLFPTQKKLYVSNSGLSLQLFHQPTLMHSFLYSLTICLLYYYPRHVSSINMPIYRRKNCIHTASGIFALCKRLHSTLVESSQPVSCAGVYRERR